MSLTWSLFLKRLTGLFRAKGGSRVYHPITVDQNKRARAAAAALRKSRELRQKIESNEPEVDRLYRSMQQINEINGFASMIVRHLGGGAG